MARGSKSKCSEHLELRWAQSTLKPQFQKLNLSNSLPQRVKHSFCHISDYFSYPYNKSCSAIHRCSDKIILHMSLRKKTEGIISGEHGARTLVLHHPIFYLVSSKFFSRLHWKWREKNKYMKKEVHLFKLLTPSGFLTYRQVSNIQKFYMALALRWVFCVDIRTDSDFCFIQH